MQWSCSECISLLFPCARNEKIGFCVARDVRMSNSTLQQSNADKHVYCCDFWIFAQVNKTNMADDNGPFPAEGKMKVRLKTWNPPFHSQSLWLDSLQNVCRMHNYKEMCRNATFTPICVQLQWRVFKVHQDWYVSERLVLPASCFTTFRLEN